MEQRTEQIFGKFLSLEKLFSAKMKVSYGGRTLTTPQLLLLDELEHSGPTQISQLAQALSCSNSTVSGILDRLESIDLVRRSHISGDLRVVHVETTDKCRELAASLGGSFTGYLESFFTGCSDSERAEMLRGLELLERCLAK